MKDLWVVLDKFSDYCGACEIQGVGVFETPEEARAFAKEYAKSNKHYDKVTVIHAFEKPSINDFPKSLWWYAPDGNTKIYSEERIV